METNNWLEASTLYQKALKLGQKYYKSCISDGRYPYPPVLDELIDEQTPTKRVELGLIDIPTERIVGTKVPGRRAAFAGNFMPLLPEDTENPHTGGSSTHRSSSMP